VQFFNTSARSWPRMNFPACRDDVVDRHFLILQALAGASRRLPLALIRAAGMIY
jgi:hypothetical protein